MNFILQFPYLHPITVAKGTIHTQDNQTTSYIGLNYDIAVFADFLFVFDFCLLVFFPPHMGN